MKTIDINCDLGEGIGNDELIMPYISSANIACGYHAGDEKTMKQTVELCKKYSVAVGAHPSYPDKENFGRTDMLLHPGEIYEMIVKQINCLEKIAAAADVPIHHVKPHGALYNMAARSKELAEAIAPHLKGVTVLTDRDDKLLARKIARTALSKLPPTWCEAPRQSP